MEENKNRKLDSIVFYLQKSKEYIGYASDRIDMLSNAELANDCYRHVDFINLELDLLKEKIYSEYEVSNPT